MAGVGGVGRIGRIGKIGSPGTGGGDRAPNGYGFLAIGSPSSYSIVYVGSSTADPRIAIATGA